MNINYAYAEVLDVLECMESKYIQMIPNKLIMLFKKNADLKYEKHIYSSKDITTENLDKKTISILALINLKYWVKDEVHKNELRKIYKENSIKKLSQKEDTINKIFEERQKQNIQNDLTIVKKEKIWNKIFKFFRNFVDIFKR